jgi:hypothetical protein
MTKSKLNAKTFLQTSSTSSGKANLKFMQCCYGFLFSLHSFISLMRKSFFSGEKFVLWAFIEKNKRNLQPAKGMKFKKMRMFFLMPKHFSLCSRYF